MQEINALSSSPVTAKPAPRHDEIAQCASELWAKYGQPANRDVEIWLEAEQRLHSATVGAREKASTPILALPQPEPPTAAARPANQGGARAIIAPSGKTAFKAVSGNRKPSR